MCDVHAGAEENYDLSEIATIEVSPPVLPWDDTIRTFSVIFCPVI